MNEKAKKSAERGGLQQRAPERGAMGNYETPREVMERVSRNVASEIKELFKVNPLKTK